MTWTAEPLGFLSQKFRVSRGGEEVAVLDISRIREHAEYEIDGTAFRVRREGLVRREWTLEETDPRGGRPLIRAQAESLGFLGRTLEVRAGARGYGLQRGFLGWRYQVEHGGREVGEIRRRSFFGRAAAAELPDQVEAAEAVMMLFLVLMAWKRRRRAAGS